jgi:hypothetical protein
LVTVTWTALTTMPVDVGVLVMVCSLRTIRMPRSVVRSMTVLAPKPPRTIGVPPSVMDATVASPMEPTLPSGNRPERHSAWTPSTRNGGGARGTLLPIWAKATSALLVTKPFWDGSAGWQLVSTWMIPTETLPAFRTVTVSSALVPGQGGGGMVTTGVGPRGTRIVLDTPYARPWTAVMLVTVWAGAGPATIRPPRARTATPSAVSRMRVRVVFIRSSPFSRCKARP